MRFIALIGGISLALSACADNTAEPKVPTEAEPVEVAAPTAPDGTPLAAPMCDYGERHPDAPDELSQFEFLIGDYMVQFHAYRNGAWTPPQPGRFARWNGYYGLGGMAIIDEWFDPDPAIDPVSPRGVNVRIFDTESAEWKMMWVHTGSNQVQDLRAEMRDGKITMWQVYPDRPNFLADFTVEDEDNWHRVSYVKDEAGDWRPQFKLSATRIPCE